MHVPLLPKGLYLKILSLFPLLLLQAGFDLGMRNGMVVAVPNPSPMDGGAGVDAAILLALEEAASKGLKGRDVTPFVLASVNATTGGQSLKSNVALVRYWCPVAVIYYSCCCFCLYIKTPSILPHDIQ